MERLPVMECIMTPSNGEHLKERKIKERGTPGEKCSLGKMGTGFLLWFNQKDRLSFGKVQEDRDNGFRRGSSASPGGGSPPARDGPSGYRASQPSGPPFWGSDLPVATGQTAGQDTPVLHALHPGLGVGTGRRGPIQGHRGRWGQAGRVTPKRGHVLMLTIGCYACYACHVVAISLVFSGVRDITGVTPPLLRLLRPLLR
jgi:hypothetical protein